MNYWKNKVSIGVERLVAPEVLFHPEIGDLQSQLSIQCAIQKVLQNVVENYNNETKNVICNNIILSGGMYFFLKNTKK